MKGGGGSERLALSMSRTKDARRRQIDRVTVVFWSVSSVGLAKAALEAINGFNLFGNQVSSRPFF